jgi:hypothetical protein
MTGGIVSLGDYAIGAADTQTGTPVANLDGMTAVTIQARLAYGSGGTAVKAYVQTSIDQGATWFDIACLAFTTAGAVKLVNLSGLTPKGTPAAPTDGALTDDTVVDGLLGDRLRVKLVSTGTYAGGTLASLRAAVR